MSDGVRYLFACKHCFSLDPKVISELNPDSLCYPFPCCNRREIVFLVETTIQSGNERVFYEYQIVRERKSLSPYANSYCTRRDTCQKNEECIFVHTFYEMSVWTLESRSQSRESLVNFYEGFKGRILHCPSCALNFSKNGDYVNHINSQFHKAMGKHFVSREHTTWKYKPFRQYPPKKCEAILNGIEQDFQCQCSDAHTESEYQEWLKRAAIYKARAEFFEDEVPVLSHIKNLIYEGKLEELNSSKLRDHELDKRTKETSWSISFQSRLRQLKNVCFIHPNFKVKHETSQFQQQIQIASDCTTLTFKVQFLNPGNHGEYIGKLFFYCASEKLYFVAFKATVMADNLKSSANKDLSLHNWSENKIVIQYPQDISHERQYEENVKQLQQKYPQPHVKNLDKVYLQNLSESNYISNMHNFLYREEAARQDVLLKLSLENCELTLSREIIVPSGSIYGDRKDGSLYGTFESPQRLTIDSDEGLLARNSCSSVLVGSQQSQLAYECKILEWQDTNIYLHLTPRCVTGLKFGKTGKVHVLAQFKLNRTMFCLRHYAVDLLEERVKLLCPGQWTFGRLQENEILSMKLDETQNSVLKQSLATKEKDCMNPGKSSFPPLLVAGPFGTGKTHTIRNVILEILHTKGSDSRILLCTHSNPAADLYIQDLCENNEWNSAEHKMLRVMYHDRKLNTVPKVVHEFCLFTENMMNFRYPTMDEVHESHLVITTFVTALALGHLQVGLRAGSFTHIFLDEASHAMEPDVIMPLSLACVESSRIVIAGDHKQINERTFTPDSDTVKTLLERMYNAYGDFDAFKAHRILLCNNYRCINELLQLISELFYKKGILKCTSDVQSLSGRWPVNFTHIKGNCVAVENGDYINELEAEQVLKEIMALDSEIRQQDVMVTAPYHSQVHLIRKKLRKSGLSQVVVYAARNVQALQFRVVILSSVLLKINCIQSQGTNFGFLSDDNLLNTVLTRAKSMVIAIGDGVTLCSFGKCAKKWEVYLEHCKRHQTVNWETPESDSINSQIKISRHKLRTEANDFNLDKPYESSENAVSQMNQLINGNNGITSGMCEEERYDDDDDDIILSDMCLKNQGDDPNKVNGQLNENKNEMLKFSRISSEDPNEINRHSVRNFGREPLFPKHCIGELEAMLKSDRAKFKRCRIHVKACNHAEAIPIDEFDIEENGPKIILNGRNRMGRTFDNDVVLVQIDEDRKETPKKTGKVMGILNRHRDPRHGFFLCKPDELNIGLMVPIDKNCPKFALHCPKQNQTTNPGTIPVYESEREREYFTDLKLISLEKVRWDSLYAVKYLRWSECHIFPLGFVAKVVDKSEVNLEECLKLRFGVTNTDKPSISEQIRKTKLPATDQSQVLKIFTIDPKEAQDLDDGLSLTKCDDPQHHNCYHVGVHITDVASHLPEGSPIDKEAKVNEKSYYGENSRVPMLCAEFAERCSLNENKIRLAISTFFHSCLPPPHIKKHVTQISFVEPQKTFVQSDKKLSYEEAEMILQGNDDNVDEESFEYQLRMIWKIVWNWRFIRLEQAAYYSDYSYDQITKQGRSRLLIEEVMLAVNANAATYLIEKNFNIQVRVQEPPDAEKWQDWKNSHLPAIQNSPRLSSISRYYDEQQEALSKFTRLPDWAKDQLPFQSKLQKDQDQIPQLHPEWRKGQLTESVHNYQLRVKGDVEVYEWLWNTIVATIDKGDYDYILMMIVRDNLHPSQVAALDELRDIQKPAQLSYFTERSLHFSLRLFQYITCSSPLRRYSDIRIQRFILKALDNKSPPQKCQNANGEADDQMMKMKRKFEMEELAKSLKKQPVVEYVSLSMISDAGLRIFFSTREESFPTRIRHLDYGHLMLDMNPTDDNNSEHEGYIKRNRSDDIVWEKVTASWTFRFYDYGKSIAEAFIQKDGVSNHSNKTVIIPSVVWRNLIAMLSNPPSSTREKKIFAQNMRKIISMIKPNKEISSQRDKMCGETRNKPNKICHHRKIETDLEPGSVTQIQLSSSLDRRRLSEPCVQLLLLADDLSVCVQHHKEALLVFAADAVPLNIQPSTVKEYQLAWEPLIRLDSAYAGVSDGTSIILNNIKVLWESIVSQRVKELDKQSMKHYFSLKKEFCRERYIDIKRDNLLCMRLHGVPNNPELSSGTISSSNTHVIVLHGIVTTVDDQENKTDKMKVFFKLFEDPHVPDIKLLTGSSNSWAVEIIKTSFMHRHLQQSLRCFSNTSNELMKNVFLHKDVPENDMEDLPQMAKLLIHTKKLDGFRYPLNDEQQEQKNLCIQQKFTVIQGPPGTGKSYMGAQIAACFSLINGMKDTRSPKKVLYCGPSNKAVDVAAKFLKNADNVKVVRMYSITLEEKIYPNPISPPSINQRPGEDLQKPDPELEEITLHKLIRLPGKKFSEAINNFDNRVKDPSERFNRDELDAYQDILRKAKLEELKNADIIICTCSLSAQLHKLVEKGIKFAQCIIDECGMCSEPETLLPITVSDPEQIVLIGDHKQLQPVIRCKKAQKLGLGTSIFSKLTHVAGMLKVQYRMDSNIMGTPSEMFYKGELKVDRSVEMRSPIVFLGNYPNNLFWHVQGKEKEQKYRSLRGGHKSKYNLEEAREVVNLLQHLLQPPNAKLKSSDVMVLSPYIAQCNKIQTLIEERKNKDHLFKRIPRIHVVTVVASQGSEAKYVILSTVRSMEPYDINDEPSIIWERKHLGFLCDPHQANVALTRAQRGLCIIGNRHLLGCASPWKEIIQHYQSKGAVLDQSPLRGLSDLSSLWFALPQLNQQVLYQEIQDEDSDFEENDGDTEDESY